MRSLRTTVLAGLITLTTLVVASMACVVYVRSSRVTLEAQRDDLRLRAKTLSGLMEFGRKGIEIEASPRSLPEFYDEESGVYAIYVQASGKRKDVRSPSNGDDRSLAVTTPWEEGAFVFEEMPEGPHGMPCASVTYSFVAPVDDIADAREEGWLPTDADRRYQVRVAVDARPRDRELADMRAFLIGTSLWASLVTVLGGLFVSRLVLKPVAKMTREATDLSPDDPTRRLDPATVVTELHSLANTLNGALDRLGDALERQRRFTSDASHELRTPVAVILGSSELLLRRDRCTGETRTSVERIHRVAERMRAVIENLLTLARADSAALELRRDRTDLSNVVESVCDDLLPLAARARLDLRTDVAPGTAVTGDARLLGQVVQNLVSNAIKFTPAGGRIEVALRVEASTAVLTVSDTGHGIAPEHLGRLFDRFYRVREGSDRREGAGLGLSIVRWVVRAHTGELDVRSTVGQGTTFEVRLPRASGTPAPVRGVPSLSLVLDRGEGDPKEKADD